MVAITLFGYPGVVCMTPAAWLLAVPVGLRVSHESRSTGRQLLTEAFLGGALLGLVQGLLLGVVMALSPIVDPGLSSDLPDPVLASAAGAALGAPLTGCLAALMAWVARRRNQSTL